VHSPMNDGASADRSIDKESVKKALISLDHLHRRACRRVFFNNRDPIDKKAEATRGADGPTRRNPRPLQTTQRKLALVMLRMRS
jgi:hypothetical protein